LRIEGEGRGFRVGGLRVEGFVLEGWKVSYFVFRVTCFVFRVSCFLLRVEG